MGTAERRNAIMRALSLRRHDKVANLALEFGVSERTIRRDIEALSLTEPIRTASGRYGGGVYILDTYYFSKKFLDQEQISVIQKTIEHRKLDTKDIQALKNILTDFTRPTK